MRLPKAVLELAEGRLAALEEDAAVSSLPETVDQERVEGVLVGMRTPLTFWVLGCCQARRGRSQGDKPHLPYLTQPILQALMPNQDKYARWRNLLAHNRISQVLEELRAVFAKSDRLSEIIQQSGRHAALSEGIRQGNIDLEDKLVVENQIREGILDLIDDIERWEGEDTTLRQELALVTIKGPVRNTLINSTVTAGGNVHVGDYHFHQQGAQNIDRFLTATPFVADTFLGREALLAELHTQLVTAPAPTVVMLNGEGGIGKSTLASAYFHHNAQHYDHLAWRFAEGGIADALLELAVGLNVEFSVEEATVSARLDCLLSALANCGGNCLLVLDNVNDLADLEANIHYLRRCSNVRVLLTSRLGDFPGITALNIGALGDTTGRVLLEHHYRPLSATEVELFPVIYAAVGGNTLVLELLAKNLRRVNALRKDKYLLSDLLTDLQNKGVLALREDKAVATTYGGTLQKAEVATIVSAMYDLNDLSEDELYLLTVFSVLSATTVPFAHLELLVKTIDDLESPLLTLAAGGWVKFDEQATDFQCNPVVAEVVRKQHADWLAYLRPFLEKLNQQFERQADVYFVHYSLTEIRPFVEYVKSVITCLDGQNDSSLMLYLSFGHYHFVSGNFHVAFESFRELGILANKLSRLHPDELYYLSVQRSAYAECGKALSALGERDQAIDAFRKEIAVQEQLAVGFSTIESSYYIQSVANLNLGDLYLFYSDKDLDKAAEYYEQSFSLANKLIALLPDGAQMPELFGAIHERFGELHLELEEYPEALEDYEQQKHYYELFYAAKPHGAHIDYSRALCEYKFGKVRQKMKDLDAATTHYQQMKTLASAALAVDPESLWPRKNLALAWKQLASVEPFTEGQCACLEEALNIEQEIVELWPKNLEAQNAVVELQGQLSKLKFQGTGG